MHLSVHYILILNANFFLLELTGKKIGIQNKNVTDNIIFFPISLKIMPAY